MDPKNIIDEYYLCQDYRELNDQIRNEWFAKRYARVQIARYRMLALKSKATEMFTSNDERFMLQFNSTKVNFPKQCLNGNLLSSNIRASQWDIVWDKFKLQYLSFLFGNQSTLIRDYHAKMDILLECYEGTLRNADVNNATFTIISADGRHM
jgi:hypothetical protein